MPEKSKTKVAIVDYGMGNLFSVKKACEHVGLNSQITADKQYIMNADAVILPGVGAFGDAMDNLNRLDLAPVLKDFMNSGKPFLGICLGFQLLMSASEEFGQHQGLNVFPGRVVKFSNKSRGERIKVPQVGWNQVKQSINVGLWDQALLKGIEPGVYMYFVHSYYVVVEAKELVATTTNYEGFEYCSGIRQGNICAFQFHPERSGEEGIKIYRNFAELLKGRELNNA